MAKEKPNEEEIQDPREQLRNYVIEAKVQAFRAAYDPCDSPDMADKWFTDRELRHYFNAHVVPSGDPMVIYLDEYLIPAGFKMVNDTIIGEPVLCVLCRN